MYAQMHTDGPVRFMRACTNLHRYACADARTGIDAAKGCILQTIDHGKVRVYAVAVSTCAAFSKLDEGKTVEIRQIQIVISFLFL